MSTIIRVKRRLEDNPQDALILMCKRIKVDAEDISPSLFVFRGTVNSQEDTKSITLEPKSNIKLKQALDVTSILEKIRRQRKEASSESRYEIVHCSRGLNEINIENDDQFDVVDLQKSDDKEKDVDYAYDLYISAKEDFDISMVDNVVSIQDYDQIYELGDISDLQSAGDDLNDDDSNDENNWRNDYPDSEHSSINESDMIKAMQNMDLGADLSSDTEEDILYNDRHTSFAYDSERYGIAYAKYKARVLAEEPDLFDGKAALVKKDVHVDDEDTNGYKDDSDDGFYYGQEEDTKQFREQYKRQDSSSGDCSLD